MSCKVYALVSPPSNFLVVNYIIPYNFFGGLCWYVVEQTQENGSSQSQGWHNFVFQKDWHTF
jgi:hypothetical protein